MTGDSTLRDLLGRMLAWEDGHVGFDAAIAGIPAPQRGVQPEGLPYSPWQVLEHLRLAQHDILEFCRNPGYTELRWPDDYWPAPEPPSADAWKESIASFTRSRDKVKALARDVDDLTAKVPTGKGNQTYLRAILLIADHTAYHVGQLVALRRALGIWK